MNPISSHREAPMLKVDSDILSTIISLLTEDFSADDASKSIRNCSQICQFWRHFILDSPSIWAKLINFNDFLDSKDQWMEEVLRRSGSSLLWISGHVHGRTADRADTLETFFFSILNDHWNRIQKIWIHLDYFGERNHEKLYNWRAIRRPAPHLQIFVVHAPPISSIPWPSLPRLFADHAPSLRVFDAQLASPISTNAPWLSALRVVHLHFPLTPSQVLDALGTMHLLESLTISIFNFIPGPRTKPTTDVDKPTINLPNLSRICFNTNLSTALRVMTALQVPSSCSFRLTYHGVDITTESISYLPLSQLTQDYIQAHRPKKIWFISRKYDFLFSDCDPTNLDALRMSTPFFFVHMTSSSLPVETSYRAVFLPPTDMSNVINLHLESGSVYEFDGSHAFLLSLVSVETIRATEATLTYLFWSLADRLNDLFPLLRIIRLEGWIDGESHNRVLDAFLQEREDAGRPIVVLGVPYSYVNTFS